MNKWMIVLGSLMYATGALAQVQPLPPLNGVPGATGTGSGNSAAASGTGISGAKFSVAAIGIGSHCSSVILEDTENPDVAWVLPRVFLGTNRFRQKLFDIVPPIKANEPWRMRFSIFIPHNVDSVLKSRGDEDDYYTHGCNLDAVAKELEVKAQRKADEDWKDELRKEKAMVKGWFDWIPGMKPAPIKYTLKPVLPYKLRIRVPGYGEATVPSKDEGGQIDTTVLQTYGWDHEVTIPFKSEDDVRRFMNDFDRDKSKIGVGVEVTVHFSAAKKNGSIKCTSHQGSVERSFKGRLGARADFQQLAKAVGGPEAVFAKDPPIDLLKFNLKGEIASSATNKEIECDVVAGTSDAFNQAANEIMKGLATDLVPSLINQQQATQLAGQLPPMLPQASPFSPLPLGGSTGLMACPPGVGTGLPGMGGGLGTPGIDPATGQPCDPTGDIDQTKHYVKLSALMSSVRKVADTKATMNLVAPPSDEKFTTFFRLIGKPENKAYRKLPIPSSLGPVQVKTTIKKVPKKVPAGAPPAFTYVRTVEEKTMQNGRGNRTGVNMEKGRIVRLYPVSRVVKKLEYPESPRWATWKDITDYSHDGIDFRIGDHKFELFGVSKIGTFVQDFLPFTVPGGIKEVPTGELEKRMNPYLAEPYIPVFTGHLYNRAFSILTRPTRVTGDLALPFTESDYNAKIGQTALVKGMRVGRGFSVGFRGVSDAPRIYSIAELLDPTNTKKNELVTVTKGTDGDGRDYIELEAKAELGELTLFNLDPHECTKSVSFDKVLDESTGSTETIKSCQSDWVTRIEVKYGPFPMGGILRLDPFTQEADDVEAITAEGTGALGKYNPGRYFRYFLKSSSKESFRKVLPKSVSILNIDLDIRNGVENDVQKLIEKKTDSIGIVCDTQTSMPPQVIGLPPAQAAQVPLPVAVVPSAELQPNPADQPQVIPQVEPQR